MRRGEAPVVTLPGTRDLAGSALTMDVAVRNLLAWTEFDFDEIFTMARTNPARLLGQPDPAPSPGRTADLVHWGMTEAGPEVVSTRLGGTVIAASS